MWSTMLVLILVLMEYGLRVLYAAVLPRHNEHVLILVLMEYGLREGFPIVRVTGEES